MTSVSEATAAARRRAARRYKSPGFRSAYVKGAIAATLGHKRASCPYEKKPGVSWGSAWRGCWLKGFDSI